MRQSWWNDETSLAVKNEKLYFQTLLAQHGIFEAPSIEDVKYFFFSLPSIIIVKGYAVGFTDPNIQKLIEHYIESNRQSLVLKQNIKIQYRM